MKCKLIVFEGSDSSGKGTQSKILKDILAEMGYKVKLYGFPNYDSPSCDEVKKYLAGGYPDATPYEVGGFYAKDRAFTFDYGDLYGMDNEKYDFLILDRYVYSNFIHQAVKFEEEDERKRFIYHFLNLEFSVNKLPIPDLTFFMDMPWEISKKLMVKRGRTDIHEDDHVYMEKCYYMAKWVADELNLVNIRCGDMMNDGEFGSFTRNNISKKIIEKVKYKFEL